VLGAAAEEASTLLLKLGHTTERSRKLLKEREKEAEHASPAQPRGSFQRNEVLTSVCSREGRDQVSITHIRVESSSLEAV